MHERLDFDPAFTGETADLVERDLSRERHAGNAERPESPHSERVVRVHLGRRMNANIRQQGAQRAQETEVLDDDCVHAGLPRAVDQFHCLVELALKHHDVRGQVDADSAEMRVPAHLSEAVEGEVLRSAAGVETLDAEVDRIGAVGDRSAECVRSAGRRQELWWDVCTGRHGRAPALNDEVMTVEVVGTAFAA